MKYSIPEHIKLIGALVGAAATGAGLIAFGRDWDSDDATSDVETENSDSPDASTTTAPLTTVAQYDFEASTQGWSADSTECPDAGLGISREQAHDGESALKWTLPASISGRCTVGVTVEPVLGELDSVVVGCWLRIPEGLRSDSSVGSDRREFGLWLYDDSFSAAFGPNIPAAHEMDEWVWIEMEPGQEYFSPDGVPAERPEAFGHLKVIRVWYNSDSELQPQEAIFIDSCRVDTPT